MKNRLFKNYKYSFVARYDSEGRPEYEYKYIGDDISGTDYDVATVQWGNGARMPTRIDMEDLLKKCIWTPGPYNNVNGAYVTGPNGNEIFLPFAGWYDAGGLTGNGINSSLWSGSLSISSDAWAFGCLLQEGNLGYDGGTIMRYHGRSIRPVKDKESIED